MGLLVDIVPPNQNILCSQSVVENDGANQVDPSVLPVHGELITSC